MLKNEDRLHLKTHELWVQINLFGPETYQGAAPPWTQDSCKENLSPLTLRVSVEMTVIE